MLCAGLCIPGWKPVVPEENLSAFRSATSKRQILFLWKAVGLAAPCQEASPLQKVFKLLWLLVWQTCPIPETQSFAVFLQAMLRTCQYSGFFQTESSPLSDRFLMEGQCHSGIGSSTQLKSLCSQRVSRHWPGNATAGLTTPARCLGHCPARVRGLSPVPLNHHSHDTGIPVHLPWCQGVQYLITGQSAGLLSRLYFCSLADYPPLTERERGWGADEQQAALLLPRNENYCSLQSDALKGGSALAFSAAVSCGCRTLSKGCLQQGINYKRSHSDQILQC